MLKIIKPAFIGLLMLGILTGCNNKDKPKEMTTDKKPIADSVCKSEIDTANIKKADVAVNEKQDSIKTQIVKNQAKIILITTSEGCKCTLAKCGEGEKIVNDAVSQFSGRLTVERIDYAKEEKKVNALSEKYKFYGLPTVLFFDTAGNFTKKIESTLDEKIIKETLTELGVK